LHAIARCIQSRAARVTVQLTDSGDAVRGQTSVAGEQANGWLADSTIA